MRAPAATDDDVGGTVLVVNAGSSSVKFQLFDVGGSGDAAGPRRRLRGQLDGVGTARPRLRVRDAAGTVLADEAHPAAEVPDLPAALDRLEPWLAPRAGDGRPLLAVGHRVVHGGTAFSSPVAVDEAVLAALEALVPLAPLHQPNNLLPIRALRASRPDVPQVACFDTAFHRGHPDLNDRYAIPEELHAAGVRRYGFHGLSYEHVASRLPEVAPARVAAGRVVVLHLGSGASACAIEAGRSVESTMGFTALDGLPMGTRPGQLDPGVVLHLVAGLGMGPAAVERLLYHECGLKGLSGESGDVRDLLASGSPRAALALDYFVHRTAREVAGLAAGMGGLDGLVFTAGIGENAAGIRARIGARCAWLGVVLDEARNAAHGPEITAPGSPVPAYVVPTDEELTIARHTLATLRGAAAAGPGPTGRGTTPAPPR